MKKIISYARLLAFAVLFYLQPSAAEAQTNNKVPSFSAAELSELRRAVEKAPGDPETHKTYITAMGIDNPDLRRQYEFWLKKYPKSVAVPLAIGERYYQKEMPQATPFLLKVVKMEPKNAKVWNMLSIDAQRWGDIGKSQEYLLNAVKAEPDNLAYATAYVGLFRYTDKAVWKQKVAALSKDFPGNDRVAIAYSSLAIAASDAAEKIEIYESMRNLFPDTNMINAVAMSRLAEAYIENGQFEKASSLSAAMPKIPAFKRLLFAELHDFSLKLIQISDALAEGRAEQARQMLPSINTSSGAYRNFEIGNAVILLTGTVLDGSGSTKMAYDTLLTYQAKRPDDEVFKALLKYGEKLGRNSQQVKMDVKAAISKNAKPSPDFNLDMYGSNEKMRLADLKGKVTLLTFWFPGCGPCRLEMPYFQEVINKYKDKKIEYLGINVYPDQDEYVMPFLKGTGYSFLPLKATWNWAQKTFNVRAAPSNFIIDQEGRIVYSDFIIHADGTRMLELMLESLM